jgi:hypothetical protein
VAILKDYTVWFLEYWAWNVPVTDTLELSPRIGGLELYALNAFRPQGAWPSLFVYFRPMSLSRYRADQERISEASEEEIVDIAPPLQTDNITVDINGSRVEVVCLNPVREYVGEGNHMDACLVQVSLPDEFDSARHSRIDIALHDPETDERGEATTFWRGHVASGP